MNRSAILALLLAAALHAAPPVTFTCFADNRGKAGLVDVLKDAARLPGVPGAFVITPGDTDPPEATRAHLDSAFGKGVPWYAVVGNHDLDAAQMAFLRRSLPPGVKRGPAGAAETCYSFDAGSVHITVVNQSWNGRDKPGSDGALHGGVAPELLAWLKADLCASDRPFKVVVGHKPAFPAKDAHWGDARHMDDSLNEAPAARDAFWRLLEAEGVAAYLCGHTHRTSRTQPAGSRVWQIDVGQARGDKDWKYDTVVTATAEDRRLTFRFYRSLRARARLELADTLVLDAPPRGK